jgi:thymidylate synthase
MVPLWEKGVKALATMYHVMLVNVTSSSLPLVDEAAADKFKKLIETISTEKSQRRLVIALTPPAAFM